MGLGYKIDTQEKAKNLSSDVMKLFYKYHYFQVEVKHLGGTLTRTQQNSLHLYFRLVAEALTDAGYSKKIDVSSVPVFKSVTEFIQIPYHEAEVKSMWSEFQLAMIEVAKTTQMPRLAVSGVYEVFNLWLGEKFGIHVPFPKKEAEPVKKYLPGGAVKHVQRKRA